MADRLHRGAGRRRRRGAAAPGRGTGLRPALARPASDRLWEKYALGERSKIIDPVTKQPAVRNVFLDEPTLGVKALQPRGTIFWQCAIAMNATAQQLANARKLPVAEVRADLAAG